MREQRGLVWWLQEFQFGASPSRLRDLSKRNVLDHKEELFLSTGWRPSRGEEASWHPGEAFVVKVDKAETSIVTPAL